MHMPDAVLRVPTRAVIAAQTTRKARLMGGGPGIGTRCTGLLTSTNQVDTDHAREQRRDPWSVDGTAKDYADPTHQMHSQADLA